MSSLHCSIYFYHCAGCETHIIWVWLDFELMVMVLESSNQATDTVSKPKSLELGMVSKPKYLGLLLFFVR